jgi:hypothetical protein
VLRGNQDILDDPMPNSLPKDANQFRNPAITKLLLPIFVTLPESDCFKLQKIQSKPLS